MLTVLAGKCFLFYRAGLKNGTWEERVCGQAFLLFPPPSLRPHSLISTLYVLRLHYGCGEISAEVIDQSSAELVRVNLSFLFFYPNSDLVTVIFALHVLR